MLGPTFRASQDSHVQYHRNIKHQTNELNTVGQNAFLHCQLHPARYVLLQCHLHILRKGLKTSTLNFSTGATHTNPTKEDRATFSFISEH